MPYEVGKINRTCRFISSHNATLTETGHLCHVDSKGDLYARFSWIHEAGKDQPIVLGATWDEAFANLERALRSGAAFTYRCAFRLPGGKVRGGLWLCKNKLKGDLEALSASFVARKVGPKRVGNYHGT